MYNPFKKIKKLEAERDYLEAMVMDSVPVEQSAGDVMNRMMGRDISWFDYKRMEYADKVTYKQDAKSILLNRTFLNEYNAYIEDLITHIAKDARIEEIESLRMGIVAMESFMERLQQVEAPEREDSDDDINDAI